MKALITGVTGQDAAYLAELLLSKGYEVHGGYRRSASGSFWRLEELGLPIELIPLDVTCAASVTNIVMEGYDEIYNLAAQSFVEESFRSPTSTFHINALGPIHFLEAIRLHSPDTRFYQASTSEMFGLVNVEAQNETTVFHPRSPYGVAKAAAHYAVGNYREAYGLHASCGILFNHESPLRGIEFVTRKVTDGIAQIIAGKTDKLFLGNMDAYRDWGHARDYVEGMWLMLQQEVPDDYVLATGKKHSVREMVRYAFNRHGIDYTDHVHIDERFMRPSDVPLLLGDATKAKSIGWEAKYDFYELIDEMLDSDLERHGVSKLRAVK